MGGSAKIAAPSRHRGGGGNWEQLLQKDSRGFSSSVGTDCNLSGESRVVVLFA